MSFTSPVPRGIKPRGKKDQAPTEPHQTVPGLLSQTDPKTIAALGALLGLGGGVGYNKLTGEESYWGPAIGSLSGLVAGYGGKHLYDAVTDETTTKKKEARLTNFLFSLNNS